MTFDAAAFNDTLDDIEKYLGYLKGNEMAYDYLMLMQKDLEDEYLTAEGASGTIWLHDGYAFPCPEQRFKVTPGPQWHADIKKDNFTRQGASVDWDAYVTELQHQTDLAYQSGTAWAAGIGGYLRSICAQFVKPDVESMGQTILAFQRDVVSELVDAPSDDWAHLGDLNARWKGEAAASFNDFYENYNDGVARCGLFAAAVNVGFASAARVLSSAQLGALDFVTKMRAGLAAQLDQWADAGWKPSGPPPSGVSLGYPTWVTDLAAVADNALTVAGDVLPDLKALKNAIEIRGNVKDIAGLVRSIATLVGHDLPRTPKQIPVETSEAIYTSLTTTLNDDYLQGVRKAMDKLDAGGGGGAPDPSGIGAAAFSGRSIVQVMNEDKESKDWTLPDVRGTNLADDPSEY